MIKVLTGEGSFKVDREIKRLINDFNGTPELINGGELELRRLPDLLMGATLFAEKRLIIIKGLAENKTLWDALNDWLPRVSNDVELVLVDEKPDKRTKTYKTLQKIAEVREFKPWGERDTAMAEEWVVNEAKGLGFTLDKKSAHTLVSRVGVDQWLLFRALEKLAVLDTVDPAVIEAHIEANPSENVFNLFEAALKGNTTKVNQMLKTLELTEDAFRLFGLLSNQALQLLALQVGEKPSAEVAKDLGVHPFALQKLAPYAKKLERRQVKKIVDAFIEADEALKTSAGEPWLLIDRALIKVCLAL